MSTNPTEPRKRRSYTKEFKESALKLADGGKCGAGSYTGLLLLIGLMRSGLLRSGRRD